MAWLERQLFLRTSALLAGGAAVGLLANAARPGGVSLRGFEAPSTCSAEAAGPEGPSPSPSVVTELGPREASFLCGGRGVVFADTRPTLRFEEGHVADAVHLPCDATEAGSQAILKHLADATTVVVYGDSTDEGRAVAAALAGRGLSAEIRVLRGGFAAWETEGLACASGSQGPTSSDVTSAADARGPR